MKKQPVLPAKLAAKAYFSIVLSMLLISAYHRFFIPPIKQVNAQSVGVISNKPSIPLVGRNLTPTVTPTPTIDNPNYQEIKSYIIEVFGTYSDKALLLLSCENHALNPDARNYNNDEFNSIDYGVFQINNHWQGVTNTAFLTDYKINIQMAYNIFSRDGYTFKLWTCGRKLGI